MAAVNQPLGSSLVRTALPFALSGAGVIIAARLLEVEPSTWVVVTSTGAIGAIYYLIARLVETHLSSRIGALMLASTPTSPAPATLAAQSAQPSPSGCGTDKDCLDE